MASQPAPPPPVATTDGPEAVLGPDGKALVPVSAPPQVRDAIVAANRIVDKPYRYGGGHGSFEDDGYDCSGTVSYALHGAGLLRRARDSSGLRTFGKRGRGTWMTISPTAATRTSSSPACASTRRGPAARGRAGRARRARAGATPFAIPPGCERARGDQLAGGRAPGPAAGAGLARLSARTGRGGGRSRPLRAVARVRRARANPGFIAGGRSEGRARGRTRTRAAGGSGASRGGGRGAGRRSRGLVAAAACDRS